MENIQQASLTLQAKRDLRVSPSSNLDISWVRAAKRISDYRLAMGWLMLVFWLAAALGLDWDAQWHADVGRDGFWTPPHWMFYSTVTVAGLICAIVVLTETFLYYRHNPGVTSKTTTPILFFFHGPVGFALAGFGMLVMLISAPFDDYWHRIYGIDLAIWTPFHVMLAIGIVMANIGIVYLFASEVNRRKLVKAEQPSTTIGAALRTNIRQLFKPAMLGLVIATAALLSRFLLLMDETYVGSAGPGSLTIANFKLPAYSVMVAGLPLVLVALALFSGRIGIATFTGLVFLLFRLASAAFSTWGIQTLALDRGQILRSGARDVQLIIMAYPIFLWVAGLIVDIIFLATREWRKSLKQGRILLTAVGASTLAGLALFLLEKPWEEYNSVIQKLASSSPGFAGAYLRRSLFAPDYWSALPVALIVATLAGLVAVAMATSLRYTDR